MQKRKNIDNICAVRKNIVSLQRNNKKDRIMDIALRNISIELPVTDLSFIETLIRKMGWTLKSQEDIAMHTENKTPKSDVEPRKQYSSRIMRLRSLRGNGITQNDIEKDERLAYLLSK